MFPKDPLFRLIALVGHLHTRQFKKRLHEKKERDPKESRGSYLNPKQLADVLNKG